MLWDPKWQARVTPEVKPLAAWQLKYLDAANDIERHGLVKGRLGEMGGPRCIIGALVDVEVTNDDVAPLLKYLGVSHSHLGYLALWNDDPRRTKEQVVFALRDCAMGGE